MSEILPDFFNFALNGFLSLFPVTDPVGAILIFLALAIDFPQEARQRVALKAAAYSVVVLLSFLLLGDSILLFFGISVAVVKIAGGIVVFATGWETLNEKQGPSTDETTAAEESIAFIPLTVPMLAGPGAISVTLSLAAEAQQNFLLRKELNLLAIAAAIALIGVSIYICLRLSSWFLKAVGKTGLIALNRLIGLFILALGVQLALNGIADWLTDLDLI